MEQKFDDIDQLSVNYVSIAGNLVNDPPLRKTKRGVPVTNFIIRTCPEPHPGEKETDDRESCFISIVAWAHQAVQCNKNLRKGSAILVVGELQSMPNASPESGFCPVQVNAQWIQYLDKNNKNDVVPIIPAPESETMDVESEQDEQDNAAEQEVPDLKEDTMQENSLDQNTSAVIETENVPSSQSDLHEETKEQGESELKEGRDFPTNNGNPTL